MTEQQRIEELMKPRYKVIADYPQGFSTISGFRNPIKKGDILINTMPQQEIVWRKLEDDKPSVHTVHNPELYPSLFKSMQWWEERKPEEMPEYVKTTGDFIVFKVKEYKGNPPMFTVHDNKYHWYATSLLPATLAEYNQYINSKQ